MSDADHFGSREEMIARYLAMRDQLDSMTEMRNRAVAQGEVKENDLERELSTHRAELAKVKSDQCGVVAEASRQVEASDSLYRKVCSERDAAIAKLERLQSTHALLVRDYSAAVAGETEMDELQTLRNEREDFAQQAADMAAQLASIRSASGSETERRKFEAWLAWTGYASSRCSQSPDSDYECEETESAWRAWQARATIDSAKETQP